MNWCTQFCIQGFTSLSQEHFEVLSKNTVKKRKLQSNSLPLEALIKRHAGVLGLSALVEAYPYDVPDFMPQVLMDLSNHVNDPQPIQVRQRSNSTQCGQELMTT